MDITPFLPLISGAIGGAASSGVFKGPVQTLQDWWYVNYGYELSEKAALLKAQQELNIKKLQESTLEKVSQIKPENIQEPALNILGPALEASRFYIEEETLREMFAQVIASSMDKTKNRTMHPSFVETIKQLSSNDALFLKEFKTAKRLPYGKILSVENKEEVPDFPIPELHNGQIEIPKSISLEEWNEKYAAKSKPFIEYFYYSNSMTDMGDNELSISSLARLGLINVKEEATLLNKEVYSEIDDQFISLKEYYESNEEFNPVEQGFHLELRIGTIDLTPFGISFFNTCV